MAIFDVGRVCRKTRGRDAGEFYVIVGKKDGMLLVEGENSKKNVSPSHLEPTPLVVDTKDVARSLKENDLI